jgi:hypothetical protein
MKKVICTSLLTGLLSCSLLAAQGTAPAAAGGRTGITPVMPRNGVTQVTPPAQSGTAGTVQQGVAGQSAPGKTATPQFTTISNAPFATNNFAGTNRFNGTNNFAGPNGLGTNGVTAIVTPQTNFPVAVNSNFNGNVVIQDQAVTPSDRILLTTLSQGVRASLGITPDGNNPVHFFIQNGTVTVVGTVQSTQQSQAVLTRVQTTPGVLSVVNDMHVAGAFAPAVQNGTATSLLGVPTDRAFSAADQTLLTTVQQEAALQLGVTATAQMPVHFTVESGVVGVSGRVSSLQEKQALIAAIQRTRGIVRVVDNVAVVAGSNGTSAIIGPSRTTVNGALTPTSRDTNQMVSTNASGF